MALPYEKVVAEDVNLGYGTVSVTMPAGGSATGNKVGVHTFLGGHVNARDFGAAGDGASDDSLAIQTAIDTVAAAGGGVVLLPRGTFRLNTGLVFPVGIPVHLRGAGRTITSLAYKGAAVALTFGDATADTVYGGVQDLTLDMGQIGASANVHGIVLTRCHECHLYRLVITSVVSGAHGTGIKILGTASSSVNHDLKQVQVTGNWTKGIYLQGDGSTLNTCNNHHLKHVSVTRTTNKPGTGSIGVHYDTECGDNLADMIDVEGYDVGYQLDGNYLRGTIRAELNTIGVNAAGAHNWLFLSPFGNTTNVVYTGSFNSIVVSEQFQVQTGGSLETDLFFGSTFKDINAYLNVRAGFTVEKEAGVRFLNKAGSTIWSFVKSTLNAFWLADSASKLRLYCPGATPNDNTNIYSTGSGIVSLNVDALGVGVGTGGVIFGDGTAGGTYTARMYPNGMLSAKGLQLGATCGIVNLTSANLAVACPTIKFNSLVFLSPVNAQATTLMRGASAPYVLSPTDGVGFNIRTADGNPPAGSEFFYWLVVNPYV